MNKQVFWVQYQTNQPVQIRTHQFSTATGQWVQTLFNVADVVRAVKHALPSKLGAIVLDELTLHAVVHGVESTLPGNQLLSLIPTASGSFNNPLIIKSKSGIDVDGSHGPRRPSGDQFIADQKLNLEK
ncbi:hypothetical protein HDU78_011125, partial [Chytriomyces hyalinus]